MHVIQRFSQSVRVDPWLCVLKSTYSQDLADVLGQVRSNDNGQEGDDNDSDDHLARLLEYL